MIQGVVSEKCCGSIKWLGTTSDCLQNKMITTKTMFKKVKGAQGRKLLARRSSERQNKIVSENNNVVFIDGPLMV